MDPQQEPHESAPVPDTSHLIGSEKNVKKSRKGLVALLIVVVIIIIAVTGAGLYYLKTQNDKKTSEEAATAKQTSSKQLTQEQQITADLTGSVQKQLSGLQNDNGVAFITTSTAAAQQVGRNLNESSVTTCNNVAAFATKSDAALKSSQQSMQAAFTQAASTLETTWKLEDQTNAALRLVSESAFAADVSSFAATPGLSMAQKAAITTYESTLLSDSHTLEATVDTAELAYRAEVSALIKTHQADLSSLVQTLVSTINSALAAAQKNCTQTSVAAMVANIKSANASLLANSTTHDSDISRKVANDAYARTTILTTQSSQFTTAGNKATATLTTAIQSNK